MTAEQLVSTRTIAAPAARIFAVLSDPAQHQHTEPTDWVQSAIDPAPLTEVGQVFSINMFFEQAGGHYVIDNTVTVFDPDRTIGWRPGQKDEMGIPQSGGWWWRYDLSPTGSPDATEVALTYDWTDVPEPVRQQFGGFPVVPVEFLDQSLSTLEQHVLGNRGSSSEPHPPVK